jgi:hypothetical protein
MSDFDGFSSGGGCGDDPTGPIGCLLVIILVCVICLAVLKAGFYDNWNDLRTFHEQYCTKLFVPYQKVVECKNTNPKDLMKYIKIHKPSKEKI